MRRSTYAPGSRIHGLEIERTLGAGAFGTVYLARDPLIGRSVALKVLTQAAVVGGSNLALREVRAVGRLQSPHVVTLFRVHPPGDGHPWMFELEFVEGGSLAMVLERDGALPVDRAVRIAREIATGLRDAGREGVVHGDVKPANVLLTATGAAKLTDFGLARLVGDISLSMESGHFGAGTPVYMAPEIIRGDRATTVSDVWSFGVVLHRMLSGRAPFEGRDLNSVFYAIHHRDPPPLPAGVPAGLARLVLRCLAKDPDQRPGSWDEVIEALEPGTTAAAFKGPPRPALLIGRDTELGRLAAALRELEGGTGAAILVSGPTGVGKSALMVELKGLATSRGIGWLEASCTPVGGLMRPLLEAARVLAESANGVTQERFGSAAEVIGSLLDEPTATRLEGRGQALWALELLVSGLAAERRLTVAVENAHECDAEDVKLLVRLARQADAAGILLVLEADTDARAAGGGPLTQLGADAAITHLPVSPLSATDTARLIERWAGSSRIPAEAAQRVVAASQGNPLFALELLRHLERTGALVRTENEVALGPSWSRATLPARIHDLVERRVADLSDDERAILDIAAVDGATFEGEAVAAVLEEPLITVLRRLQKICRTHAVVQPGERGYRFSNALFQQSIYADLAPELRREVHLKLARHLEARRGEPGVAERLGLHWEGAGEHDRAVPHLIEAAEGAAARQEFLRAIDLARRAGIEPERAEMAHDLDRGPTLFRIAACYHAVGRTDDASALIGAVADAAAAAGDSELRMRAAVRLARLRYATKGAAAVDTGEIEEAAVKLPRCVELGRARYLLGLIAKYRDDLDQAESWMRSADAVYQALGRDPDHAAALDGLASIALRRGRLREAEALYGDAARIAAHTGQRANAAVSNVNRALASLQMGEPERAASVLEESIHVLALEGARYWAAHAKVILASARFAAGERESAQAAVEDALAVLDGSGVWLALGPAHLERAHLAASRGDLDPAWKDLERAKEAARRADDRDTEATALAMEALIAAWSGDLERASAAADRATHLGDAGESPLLRAAVATWLLEATLYGLPRPAGIGPLTEAGSLRKAPWAEGLLAALRGLDAFSLPAAPADVLDAAAEALLGPPFGERRAILRVLASLLRAEALRRRGDADAGARAAEARAAARAIGHVWLEKLVERAFPAQFSM